MTNCDGGKLDPSTSRCWQDPPSSELYEWEYAVTYCDGLDLGGHDDWWLPSVSELRGLVRGCAGTAAGGDCGVTDDCTDEGCWDEPCDDWSDLGGPGTGGCHWDAKLSGECDWYWSSSTQTSDTIPMEASPAWGISFSGGYIYYSDKTSLHYVRCVRGE
jgi:hypothetical protein